jgi:hypothetical protein
MSDQVPPERPVSGGQDGPAKTPQDGLAAQPAGEQHGGDQPTVEQAVQSAGPQDAAMPQPDPPQSGGQHAGAQQMGAQNMGAQPPGAGPQQAAPQPPYGQVPPGMWGAPPPPRQPGGFRRFAGNRVTQLVAVGVLGLVVGGGIVGGVMAATQHDGRPGISRVRDGGGHHQFRGGAGLGRGGAGGTNNGTSGSGTGI